MAECPPCTSPWRHPAVQRPITKIGDEQVGRQLRISLRNAIRQMTEVETAASKFCHERFLAVSSGHCDVRYNLSNAPPFAQRRRIPSLRGERIGEIG